MRHATREPGVSRRRGGYRLAVRLRRAGPTLPASPFPQVHRGRRRARRSAASHARAPDGLGRLASVQAGQASVLDDEPRDDALQVD